MSVSVSIEFAEMVVDTKEHIFHKLMDNVQSVIFSMSDSNNVKIKFVFTSLWNKA